MNRLSVRFNIHFDRDRYIKVNGEVNPSADTRGLA